MDISDLRFFFFSSALNFAFHLSYYWIGKEPLANGVVFTTLPFSCFLVFYWVFGGERKQCSILIANEKVATLFTRNRPLSRLFFDSVILVGSLWLLIDLTFGILVLGFIFPSLVCILTDLFAIVLVLAYAILRLFRERKHSDR